MTCNIHTSSVVWSIQPGDTLISFNCATDDTGDIKIINNIYNAIHVNEIPPSTSTLAFVLNGSLDGVSITCRDGGFHFFSKTLYLLF